MFPSNGERATMAGGEVKVEEPQMGDRKGNGKKEIYWIFPTYFLLSVG